jgi:hypothetical protein
MTIYDITIYVEIIEFFKTGLVPTQESRIVVKRPTGYLGNDLLSAIQTLKLLIGLCAGPASWVVAS